MISGGFPRYFADENLLGFAILLMRSGSRSVLFPGHPDLPGVPRGCQDIDWMRAVAARDLIVLTRDRRIHTRPAEVALFRALALRSVWLGGKNDLGPRQQVDLFLEFEERLASTAAALGPGPWALRLTPSGLRTMGLRRRRQ